MFRRGGDREQKGQGNGKSGKRNDDMIDNWKEWERNMEERRVFFLNISNTVFHIL
jgi:hypothetical protein